MKILIARTGRGDDGRAPMLCGLRGVGKTVLLNTLADQAEREDWFTVRVEARATETFEYQLARALRDAYRSVSWRHDLSDRVRSAFGTVQSFSLKADLTGSVSAGIDVDPQRGRADSGNLEADIYDLSLDLSEAAIDRKVGIALFIDELQEASAMVLRALTHAVHRASQTQRPFYVVGAGLPSLVGGLSEASSYSERLFEYRQITQLTPGQSAEVLQRPARAEGVSWESAAIDLIVGETAGYPYFLQEFGRAAWDAAPGPDIITRSDALAAVNDARQALDHGFFRARWDRATRAERSYLAAMSKDGSGPSSTADVANRLGKPPSAFGPARANLINKGLIYSPEHGQIAYTVPGMADFIRREIK